MDALIKLLPIVGGGIILTVLVTLTLRTPTMKRAVESHLIIPSSPDKTRLEALESLIKWRDLLIAVYTALYVLAFAATDKLVAHANPTGDPPAGRALRASSLDVPSLAVLVIILFILPCMFIAADKMKLKPITNDRIYWPSLLLILAILYGLASYLVITKDT